jgi:hypothetical protein
MRLDPCSGVIKIDINCGHVGSKIPARCHEGRLGSFVGPGHASAGSEVGGDGVRDCVGMLARNNACVGSLFLHNIRELLEKLGVGEEGVSLAETVELSLLHQSTICPSIILREDDLTQSWQLT